MLRKLEVATVIGFSVFALSAWSTSSAQAEFHSSVEHTLLDGNQVGSDLLAFNAGGVSCSSIAYSGTRSAKTGSTITLTPAYKSCNAFGFPGVTIDVNGCALVLHSAVVNTAEVSCPGAPIEITGPNCTLTIGSQAGLGSAAYVTEGSSPKRDLKIKLALTGLKYTQHGKGATPCTSAAFSNGTYQAEATVSGKDTAGAQSDLWVEEAVEPPGIFHSSSGHTIFDGAQTTTNIFTFNSGTVTCKNISFSGTQSVKTPSKLPLVPAYSGCSWFFGGVTIDSNGCLFLFEASQMEIFCPVGPMEFTFPGCSMTLGSQTLPGVTYATQGTTPKRDVKATFNLKNIAYSDCTGSFTNGTYQGVITITGTDTLGSQVDFWTE